MGVGEGIWIPAGHLFTEFTCEAGVLGLKMFGAAVANLDSMKSLHAMLEQQSKLPALFNLCVQDMIDLNKKHRPPSTLRTRQYALPDGSTSTVRPEAAVADTKSEAEKETLDSGDKPDSVDKAEEVAEAEAEEEQAKGKEELANAQALAEAEAVAKAEAATEPNE